MGSMFSSPKVQSTAPAELAGQERSLAQKRAALLETEGGVLGEEVQDVKQRETLLGN